MTTADREYPPHGGAWLGNASVYEEHRRTAAGDLLEARELGDEEAIALYEAREAEARRLRDREHRRMELAAINRSQNMRRYYGRFSR